MGCGGCGGVHDPYAAYRNKGKRMSRGTSVGVIKSARRLAREAGGPPSLTAPQDAVDELLKRLAKESKERPKQNTELYSDVPNSGIIKSKKRLAREAAGNSFVNQALHLLDRFEMPVSVGFEQEKKLGRKTTSKKKKASSK